MRPVPETWEAFQKYWDQMCRNVLEDNKATRDVLDLSGLGVPPFLSWLPDPIWAILRIPVAKGFVWLTVGMYDQPVRDLLGYRWTTRDERLHTLAGRAVGAVFRLVPWRYRYHPRARAGWDRETGRAPAHAPLVHTPRHNLPPLGRRDDPQHYSPKV